MFAKFARFLTRTSIRHFERDNPMQFVDAVLLATGVLGIVLGFVTLNGADRIGVAISIFIMAVALGSLRLGVHSLLKLITSVSRSVKKGRRP